jgi:hypothetical protein
VSLPANPRRVPLQSAGRAAYHLAKALAASSGVGAGGGAWERAGTPASHVHGAGQTLVYTLPRVDEASMRRDSFSFSSPVEHEQVRRQSIGSPTGSVVGGTSTTGRPPRPGPAVGGSGIAAREPLSPREQRLQRDLRGLLNDIDSAVARIRSSNLQ